MTAQAGSVADGVNLDDLDWWTRPAPERDAVFAHY
ncbi:MAG: hypothetical protein QOJ23_1697, partial [Actinomycetota bacterium]|nr:hypothetical protein [Actinomycetota bacterium]